MRISLLGAVAVLAAGLTVFPAPEAESSSGSTLVELRPAGRCAEAVFVTGAGGTLVAPSLGLYLVPNAAAAQVVPALRARGSLRYSAPNRPAGTLAVKDFSDPLVPTEWWRAVVGVDTLTPPPAGRAVTIVDSGIDVSHPEFLGRENTETLNAQEPAGFGGEHGTSVASLVAAPANGLGLVGIYPEALLRSWDAANGEGTELVTTEIVQGILAAANNGPGVINLSLGSDRKELPIEQAIYEAVSKGTLIVAASGNDGAGHCVQGPAFAAPDLRSVITAQVARVQRAGRLPMAESGRRAAQDLADTGVALFDARCDLQALYPVQAPRQPLRFDAAGLQLDDWLTPLRCAPGAPAEGVWLQLSPSRLCDDLVKLKPRCDALIPTWIALLAAAACGLPVRAVLVGRDATVTLDAPPQADAAAALQTLMQAWRDGMVSPLPLAARTALALLAGGDPVGVYEGRSFPRGGQPAEGDEPCLARLYPDFESLAADGRFGAAAEALFGPMLRWIDGHATVRLHAAPAIAAIATPAATATTHAAPSTAAGADHG